jgi:hypothetical protein
MKQIVVVRQSTRRDDLIVIEEMMEYDPKPKSLLVMLSSLVLCP